MEVLSSDISENLQFDALTDLCIEIGARLVNSNFANHERARARYEKTGRENKQKMWLSVDEDDKKILK